MQGQRKRLLGTDFVKNLNLKTSPADFPILLRDHRSALGSPLQEAGEESAVVVIHRKVNDLQAMRAAAQALSKGQKAVIAGQPYFLVTGVKPAAGIVFGRRENGFEVIADLPLVLPFNPAARLGEFSAGDTVVSANGATYKVNAVSANGLIEAVRYGSDGTSWGFEPQLIAKAGHFTKSFPESSAGFCGLKAGGPVFLDYDATANLIPSSNAGEVSKEEAKRQRALRQEMGACKGVVEGFFFTLVKVKWNCDIAPQMGSLHTPYALISTAQAREEDEDN